MKLLFLVKSTVPNVGFKIYYKENDHWDRCYKAVKLDSDYVYMTERSLDALMARIGKHLRRNIKCC